MTVARPILFSPPMVRALLAGTKTQTRRVVKPQPPTPEAFRGSDFGLDRAIADGVKMYSQNDYARLPKHPTDWGLLGSVGVARDAGFPMRYRCPYGQPCDLLWVKETHQRFDKGSCDQHVWYGAGFNDGLDPHVTRPPADLGGHAPWPRDREGPGGGLPYTVSSIHMPRWASRLTLEITDLRVERLQAISEADAEAEGVREPSLGEGLTVFAHTGGGFIPRASAPPLLLWEALWRRINGDDSWTANPWVWAVSFKVHRANVDDVLQREAAQ